MHRMQLTPQAASGIVLPAIGDPFMGGYYAGIIDTTQAGSIVSEDAYQTGKRYALIIGPKSMETSSATWATAASLPAGTKTRWDGLSASAAMPAGGVKNALALFTAPSDGGSIWYAPAIDEAELLYRNFKPDTTANATGAVTASTFPSVSWTRGVNLASSPQGAAYTTNNPTKTTVALFDSVNAGAQAFASNVYWTSTGGTTSAAWTYNMTSGSEQATSSQGTARLFRPVRRVYL